MSKPRYSLRLMVKCARLYYEEGLKQDEISEKLQVSKSTISRIISNAKEAGIVKIIVNNPEENEFIELEEALEKRFELKEVIVINSHESEDDLKRELGKEMAEYLQRVVKDGQLIGVTWGSTLKNIAQFVKVERKSNITFIPMVGGLGEINIDIHSNQISLELAKAFNANYKAFHAPFIVDDLGVKELFVQDKNISIFYEMFNRIDIGVIGIGSPSENKSTLVESGYYSKEQIYELVGDGAVADVNSFFIDNKGDGEKFEFNKRILGVDLDRIKKIPLSIGIAGYSYKKEAILATIKGKYINVLITDSNTAKDLLK